MLAPTNHSSLYYSHFTEEHHGCFGGKTLLGQTYLSLVLTLSLPLLPAMDV